MRLLERWRSRSDSAPARWKLPALKATTLDTGCSQAQAFVDTQLLEAGDAASSPADAAQAAQARYQRLLDALAQRRDEGIAVAVSLPFCVSRCLCCDRTIQAAQPSAVIDAYIEALAAEAQALAQRSGPGRDVLQLHLGGGSVNELNATQLLRLQGALQQAWRLPADAELSVDVDPRRATWQQLQLLASLGYRRITFGVFDFASEVQEAIGRSHSPALVDDACRLARECGFELITLDLMLGLPRQAHGPWQVTIQQVLDIAPDRIRLLRWPGVPVHERAPGWRDELAQTPAQLLLPTRLWLAGAGYLDVDGDLYVLETDELLRPTEAGALWRSRIATTVMPPTALLGLGAGAVGELEGYLTTNEPHPQTWQGRLHAGELPIRTLQSLRADTRVLP